MVVVMVVVVAVIVFAIKPNMNGYKPELTNPQHTEVEIFKGKIKRKYINLGLEFYFLTKCFRQSINT
jgi:hypothetical protein